MDNKNLATPIHLPRSDRMRTLTSHGYDTSFYFPSTDNRTTSYKAKRANDFTLMIHSALKNQSLAYFFCQFKKKKHKK